MMLNVAAQTAVSALPIGKKEVENASRILQRYKAGKSNLERRVVENEQWYKLRHWEYIRGGRGELEPTSAWLFHCLANKHADAMDNFPMPNILPREESDRGEAELLGSVLPVILDQCDFEETYSAIQRNKLKTGTGIYGCFWDRGKHGGLGDISVVKIDVINLFWEPGITDIQRSRNLFHVELYDNDILLADYPFLEGKLGTGLADVKKYVYDDTVDTSEKSAVVDWYYKKRVGGKTLLHYVKYVGDTVLFASENDPAMAASGWYRHGLYPFVFDPLFTVEGSPAGFGYIDIGKNAQTYIDKGNQAILKNMLAGAAPRYFIRSDGAVNEEEYADLSRDFIHVDAGLGQDSILPVQTKGLNDIYVSVVNNKVEELKQTTGTRDVTLGGTSGGVTAASAIAALQEAASKDSRNIARASYRAYRKLCLMVIELMREFYDLPRCFRIVGEKGTARYVSYSNAGLRPQSQGMEMGVDMGYRVPLFDIEVSAQKKSPYSRLSQNEMALNFFERGFFDPRLADQASACLEMMDFDRKNFVMERVLKNGGLYRELEALKGELAKLSALVYGNKPALDAPSPDTVKPTVTDEAVAGEPAVTKKARERTAMAASVG
ncbi:MAG: hypothetical protein IJV98_02095 [Clostridia bacterium]|nr:hypothetical protein [Clostridia bacterium]